MKISGENLGVAFISFMILGCFFVRVENHYGRRRVIFNQHGSCLERENLLDDAESVARHRGRVRLYPVLLEWGILVPPNSKENPPAGTSAIWMCYEHAHLWNHDVKRKP